MKTAAIALFALVGLALANPMALEKRCPPAARDLAVRVGPELCCFGQCGSKCCAAKREPELQDLIQKRCPPQAQETAVMVGPELCCNGQCGNRCC